MPGLNSSDSSLEGDFRPVSPKRARARGRAPPDVRHHLASRRGQDHAHREAAAVCRRDRAGRRGSRPQGSQGRDVRLDGARAAARHLDYVCGARVRDSGAPHVAPRHARPQGLQRRHVPRAHRRRQRRHGDRRGERRRVADAKALRGLPASSAADSDVRQQVRSARRRIRSR